MIEILSQKYLFDLHLYDLIGYLAILLNLIGFLVHSSQKMRVFGILSTGTFGINIYFYNGLNGLFISSVSIFIKILSFFVNDENKLKKVRYFIPVLGFIFYYFFNKEGLVGLLPTLSLFFIILADIKDDPIEMKKIYYGSTICWLLYGIILGSIPAIIFDLVGIIALTISIKKLKKIK